MPSDPLDRRQFLKATAGAAALAALAPSLLSATVGASGRASDALVGELVKANDDDLGANLARQIRRPGHRWHGGIRSEYGFPTPHATAGVIAALACAVGAKQSRHFQSKELVEPLTLATAFMLEAQHDDDHTIDLYSTNFHSTPDLGFVVEVLAPAYVLLRDSPLAGLAPARENLGRFLVDAGEGMITGGIHTPNHRWVVSAALAWVNHLFPNPRCVGRIDQWLAETIDIDPDGQYTEKSTTVYSPIVDRALITIARLLDRPALFDPVRRNLEMTLYYIHPDGEVVTEASRRQDRYQRGSMARYYYAYRSMALRDGNGRFAAMVATIEATARDQLRGELAAFLTEPEFGADLPRAQPLPTDYVKVFAYSNLARIRRGERSGTVLAGNTTVFSFRKGAAALEALRFASAFFGKGQFSGEALEVSGNRYRMRQRLEGPYFQPLTREQIAGGDHARMAPNGTLANDSKALRRTSNVQTLVSEVEIIEERGEFSVRISITGTNDVPAAVELSFRHGGTLAGVTAVKGSKDSFLLTGDRGTYTLEGDTIEFSGGRAEHTYVHLRGALPKWDGQSVYLTALTPCEFVLKIR